MPSSVSVHVSPFAGVPPRPIASFDAEVVAVAAPSVETDANAEMGLPSTRLRVMFEVLTPIVYVPLAICAASEEATFVSVSPACTV